MHQRSGPVAWSLTSGQVGECTFRFGEFVLGTAKDAMLPDKWADLIVVIDAYHHFTYPADMLASLSKALKTDGRLAIIDFDKVDKPTRGAPPPGHVRLNRDEAINEIVSNGFRLVKTRDFMQSRQYIAIFVRDHAADPPNEAYAEFPDFRKLLIPATACRMR